MGLIKEIGEEGTVYQLSIGENLQESSELKCAKQGVGSWDSKGDSELPLILSKIPFTDWQKKRKLSPEYDRRQHFGKKQEGDDLFLVGRSGDVPLFSRYKGEKKQLLGVRGIFLNHLFTSLFLCHSYFALIPSK